MYSRRVKEPGAPGSPGPWGGSPARLNAEHATLVVD
jgi:hypothetical protein